MWQPIETAPKDGSSILLATPKGRIADGFWSPVYGVWSWPYVMVEPTNWMPLTGRPNAQAQPAPSFADAYQGAMEDVAIWKKRALEAEDLNRKFVAEINGPTYMGEPFAWLHETRRDSDVVTDAVKHVWGKVVVGSMAAYSIPLYALPGAQPAPSEQDESVRKSWARFSHELHRSPDTPYPGMSEAFEQHFSQSFIDREWRAEAATWAAAWKAAKRHCAQPAPSVPDGFAWPECPKRRQSHVLFDDGYEEGWAACVATIKAALAAPEAKP